MNGSSAKLYPASDDPRELRRVVQEHARKHEMMLATQIATHERIVDLEKADEKQDGKLEAITAKLGEIQLAIVVAETKVKSTLTTLSVVWTGLAFLIGLIVTLTVKLIWK